MTGRRSDNPGPSKRWEVYQDLVRVGERALGFQIQIMLDRFDRTDRLVRLGVVIIAGMVAVPGFLIAQGVAFPVAGSVGAAAGILAVGLAVHLLVRLNTALHREQLLDLGPNPDMMVQTVDEQRMAHSEYVDYHAHLLPKHVRANQHAVHSISARQERAILLIIIGVALHVAALGFIVGGHIHG